MSSTGAEPAATWWHGGRLVTLAGAGEVPGAEPPWGLVEDGGLLVEDGQLLWVGTGAALPPELAARIARRVALEGALVTPGLIDCHTHLVYGGHRAREFELRLAGASYEEIARAGGGIRATVTATRVATDAALYRAAADRAATLLAEGVTTLEIKSGYGLSLAHEARCLRAARRIGQQMPVTVRTTALAAHALPHEYTGRADDYIDAVCAWLPQWHAEGLVDAVDAYCEPIAFTPAQVQRVFEAARALGLPVKLHAEQLSNQHGAALAARHGALSCDHLEHLDDAGVAAMAQAGTVAVLLPGAYYFLRETRCPPVAALRAAGVPIALATDHNPGSAPGLSLLLMLNMACTFFRVTPEEALRGVTVHAAQALGLVGSHGRLRAGAVADFVLWNVGSPAELAYWFGCNPCLRVVRAGVETHPSAAP